MPLEPFVTDTVADTTTDTGHQTPSANSRRGLFIVALSLLLITLYLLYSNYLQQDQDKPTELAVDIKQAFEQQPLALNLKTLPTLKIPPSYFQTEPSAPVAEPLPTLPAYEKSNDFIGKQFELKRWQALNISTDNLAALDKDFFLQRSVAFLDGLARGVLLNKLLPFTRPTDVFIEEKKSQVLSMGASNFQRYDAFIDSIIAIDTKQAAAFFHWTRPLLETAYGELGYPDGDLGGTLLTAIDTLLATPTIEGPIALKRNSVLYQYADPAIEGLPSAQKQLLRMGAENNQQLKAWLKKLRFALLASGQNE